MELLIKNNNTFVSDVSDHELEAIIEYCTLDVESRIHQRDKQGKVLPYTKVVSRKQCYFNRKEDSFPTGWTPRIFRLSKNYSIVDRRKKHLYVGKEFGNGKLSFLARGYQWAAVNLAEQVTRGIIEHATGAGKTNEQILLISKLQTTSLVMVPSRNCLNQTHERLKKEFGESVGIIGDGRCDVRVVNVATVQSLWSKFEEFEKTLFKETGLLILDEAHHCNVKVGIGKRVDNTIWFKVAQAVDAYYKIGFTATVGDVDSNSRKLLEGATGKVLHTKSYRELAEMGHLVPIKVYMHRSEIKVKGVHYSKAYRENIVDNEGRNYKIIHEAIKYSCMDKRVLIVCNQVKHAKSLLGCLETFSVKMYDKLIIGSTPTEKRKRIIDDFVQKKFNILIGTVFGEAVDIPEIDVLILASGGGSAKPVIQKVGRACRTSEGKEEAVIIDFYDHGGGMIENHARMRKQLYETYYRVEPEVI